MTTTELDAPPAGPPPKAPTSFGDKVRFGLRGVGQTLITLGLVVLLFVVYEVWITNLFADRNNSRNIAEIQKEYDTVLGLPGDGTSTIPIGKGIGILYIPRLGRDYAEAIVQGNDTPNDDQLEQGTAHYGNTQMPGQAGNFAVAGHRVGKGEPFLNIDKLRSGDAVIVETRTYWYVYRVLGTPAGGNPQSDTPATIVDAKGNKYTQQGRQIIDPSDGDVLRPIPNHPEVPLSDASEKLMTMTTCHPKFTASHRMIIYSVLDTAASKPVSTVKGQATVMPASIKALYNQGGA